jgi:hypothetical protein
LHDSQLSVVPEQVLQLVSHASQVKSTSFWIWVLAVHALTQTSSSKYGYAELESQDVQVNALPEQVSQNANESSQLSQTLLVSFPNVPSGHTLTHVVSLRNSNPSFPQLSHTFLSVSLHDEHGVSQNSHSLVTEL